jgi:hypothetical protein
LKFKAEDPLLKGPAGAKIKIIQEKDYRIAHEIPFHPVDDPADGGMGAMGGARKGFLYARFDGALPRRKQYAHHRGRGRLPVQGPDKADFSIS